MLMIQLLLLVILATAAPAGDSIGQIARPQPAAQISPDAEVIQKEYVTEGSRKGELLLRLAHGEVKADLGWDRKDQVLRFEATRGTLGAADSNVSIQEKLGLLRLLLARLPQETDLPDAFTFITDYLSELNLRLAEASALAKAWDKTNGRPFSGSTNRFVKDLMNERHLYVDLEKVFERAGYSVTVSDVENVLVEEVRSMKDPGFASVRHKLLPRQKLPTTASLYFAVKRGKYDSSATKTSRPGEQNDPSVQSNEARLRKGSPSRDR
jgi:hypothetical protein